MNPSAVTISNNDVANRSLFPANNSNRRTRTLLNNPLVGRVDSRFTRVGVCWSVDPRFLLRVVGRLATVWGRDSVSGDRPDVSVAVETQVDEPTEVDGGDP